MKNFLPALLFVCIFFSPLKVDATIHTVLVADKFFSPATINVTVGDTVRWQWVSGFHTTTCDPGIDPGTSLPAGASTWNAPMDPGNPVFNYVVMVAGTYQYVCLPHSPFMAGTINATGGGTVFLVENFDYPAGDSLGAHGWVSFSGGATNQLMVTSPGLTFSGYPLSGIGNATTLTTTGQDAYKQLNQIKNSGSIYASFMVNVTAAQTGDYFLMFIRDNSTTNFHGRVHSRNNAGQLNFGITKGANADVTVWGTTDYSFNTTYLVVLKYTFIEGTANDEVSLFVFPSTIPVTEPTPDVGPSTFPSSDATEIARVGLRQGSSTMAPDVRIDGIMVTTTWGDIITGINPDPVTHIANDFILYQNYPNPFNPSTTISFAIPQNGFVDLKVYNILGREVALLVNQSMDAGTYNVNFNAGNLSSGIYFYRMDVRTGDGNFFSDSKKLLLIK